MRAIATTKTTATNAINLVSKISRSMKEFIDFYKGNDEDDYFRFEIKEDSSLSCTPDSYNATFGWRHIGTPGTKNQGTEFYGETCGGNFHALRVFLDGRLEVEHKGVRNSSGSLMFDHLPEWWWENRKELDWKLVEYETSEAEWGVKMPIIGKKFGKEGAPTCLLEAEYMEAEKKTAEMKEKYSAVGRVWPESLKFNPTFGWVDDRTDNRVQLPRWTAVEYRRAGASGINL